MDSFIPLEAKIFSTKALKMIFRDLGGDFGDCVGVGGREIISKFYFFQIKKKIL
jgi:hypothetical protein